MSESLSPVCYLVTLPYAGRSMAVGPFARRGDAEAFVKQFLSRVELTTGEVTIGPMYAAEDVLGILDD